MKPKKIQLAISRATIITHFALLLACSLPRHQARQLEKLHAGEAWVQGSTLIHRCKTRTWPRPTPRRRTGSGP
ncbi:hypothetical protein Sjap_022659 [Stephania japonica]|uniref:Uncharacterized protein n=1 Tax=Stephania japonica TaxID=461633 RepID=A0AAP0ESE3_9MAGN